MQSWSNQNGKTIYYNHLNYKLIRSEMKILSYQKYKSTELTSSMIPFSN